MIQLLFRDVELADRTVVEDRDRDACPGIVVLLRTLFLDLQQSPEFTDARPDPLPELPLPLLTRVPGPARRLMIGHVAHYHLASGHGADREPSPCVHSAHSTGEDRHSGDGMCSGPD